MPDSASNMHFTTGRRADRAVAGLLQVRRHRVRVGRIDAVGGERRRVVPRVAARALRGARLAGDRDGVGRVVGEQLLGRRRVAVGARAGDVLADAVLDRVVDLRRHRDRPAGRRDLLRPPWPGSCRRRPGCRCRASRGRGSPARRAASRRCRRWRTSSSRRPAAAASPPAGPGRWPAAARRRAASSAPRPRPARPCRRAASSARSSGRARRTRTAGRCRSWTRTRTA